MQTDSGRLPAAGRRVVRRVTDRVARVARAAREPVSLRATLLLMTLAAGAYAGVLEGGGAARRGRAGGRRAGAGGRGGRRGGAREHPHAQQPPPHHHHTTAGGPAGGAARPGEPTKGARAREGDENAAEPESGE